MLSVQKVTGLIPVWDSGVFLSRKSMADMKTLNVYLIYYIHTYLLRLMLFSWLFV